MSDKLNIDELERLAKAATPGPWEYREVDGVGAVCHPHGWIEVINPSGGQENADAEYCVAAVNALPELIRRVREAEEDARRLDYIEKHARRDPKMDGNDVFWPTAFNQALRGRTLRDAIDKKMEQTK